MSFCHKCKSPVSLVNGKVNVIVDDEFGIRSHPCACAGEFLAGNEKKKEDKKKDTNIFLDLLYVGLVFYFLVKKKR